MDRRSLLYRSIHLALLSIVAALPFGLSRLLTPDNSKPISARNPQLVHDRLRPPGAIAQDHAFISACIGCGLCGEVCPPRCIQFYSREGAENANTPYIEPSSKGCTLCGKCMEVCPTQALTVTESKKITMGQAQIDRLACYPWVDRGICGACAAICPLGENAIEFAFANMYRPVIKSACVGCGLCVEICPHPSLPIRVKKPPTEVS